MSSMTKRKHVTREVLEDFSLPTPTQSVVRVLGGRGNNLHEVEDAQGHKYLCSMPTKYRRSIWVKRGDFVVVEPIPEGDKVKAEICQVLYKDQIRYFKSEGVWPQEFETAPSSTEEVQKRLAQVKVQESGSESESESDSDGDLFVNTNRQQVMISDDDEETSSSSSDSDNDDDDQDNKHPV